MQAIPKKSNDVNTQLILDEIADVRNGLKLVSDEMTKVKEKVWMLPCSVHIEKFRSYDDHIKRHNDLGWAIFLVVVGFITSLVAMGNAWGGLNRSVNEHHKTAEKVFDVCCPGVSKL